eukprot:TRINITY_DN3457_c0_g1_i1.p1 TRINITY_DN3457_c0_g1~~TRINITY_DN3457_c0_g1_i1.p1  ORF type:complete len:442 (+),score=43.54 TRINITY_DN3457_c0_g1_i1:152-1477(+)
MASEDQLYLQQRGYKQQVSVIQEIPEDFDQLKNMYIQSRQEIRDLQQKLQLKEQEFQMQKKSLSNLALTVVNQDKHIKNLLSHINQQQQSSQGGGYVPQQPGISDSGFSGGQSQSSGDDEEQEFYDDVPPAEAEDEEMYELKQQILTAHDFLKDLELDSDIMQGVPQDDGKRRRNSRINSRASSPYSQKSLGMSDMVNPKPPTPPASIKGGYGRENHRRQATMDSGYSGIDDDTRSTVSRTRSIQPRQPSRQPYNTLPRYQSVDSFQDDSYSMVSARGEDRFRRRGDDSRSDSRSFSRNGGITYRDKGEQRYGRSNYADIEDNYQEESPLTRRSSYATNQRTSRDFSGDILGRSELRRNNVGRLGSRLDGGGYSATRNSNNRLAREDSYQVNHSNGHRRTRGPDLEDEFDVGALKDKISALEIDNDEGGWPIENDNNDYMD